MLESKPANKRGNARLGAVQALYQMEVGGTGVAATVAEYENFRLGREIDGEQYRDSDPAWFRQIVAGVVAEQVKIDPVLHGSLAAGWQLARIDSTLRATLRAAVWELRNKPDVSARVIVVEYVEVAKAFFEGGEEPKVVNGVLNRLARQLRPDEFEETA
ncbi:MAG: transcription antitermination factor NusB [Pseudomonadota bacterium]